MSSSKSGESNDPCYLPLKLSPNSEPVLAKLLRPFVEGGLFLWGENWGGGKGSIRQPPVRDLWDSPTSHMGHVGHDHRASFGIV